MTRPRFPVVVFDLDGTLLRGTSVSLYLAERMGQGELLVELERRFRAGEISNREIADATAMWFAGLRPEAIWEQLESAPWIGGMRATLSTLTAAGCRLLLGTVTWRFAAEMLMREHGLDAVSGTEMGLRGGCLSGVVTRYFDEYDKAAFVKEWCAHNGYSLNDVVAVGDSRSDLPLFGVAGFSIALNATSDARSVADVRLDTDDSRDLLKLLLWNEEPRPVDDGQS